MHHCAVQYSMDPRGARSGVSLSIFPSNAEFRRRENGFQRDRLRAAAAERSDAYTNIEQTLNIIYRLDWQGQ